MRRVITFICVFSVLVFALCVPAFALSSSVYINPYYFDLINVKVPVDGVWVPAVNSIFSYPSAIAEQKHTTGRLYVNTGQVPTSAWRASFSPLDTAGSMTVNSGDYFNANITIQSSSYQEQYDIKGALYVTTSDDIIYEFPLVFTDHAVNADGSHYGYILRFGGTLTVGTSFVTSDSVFEFYVELSNGTSSTYEVLFNELYLNTSESPLSQNTAKVVESIDQAVIKIQQGIDESTNKLVQKLQAVMDKLEDVFGDLSNSIDEQTDELTNGWENTGDEPADVGGAADDLGQAESDALGGKTDSEIQQEVNNALSGEGLPDFETSFVIADLFDRLLWSFGTGYQSLLILSLTLGLAAFLIGRSWSKGV